MTTYERKKIEQALAETQRFIDKESARNRDLRPAKAWQLLNEAYAHKAKLLGMLGVA